MKFKEYLLKENDNLIGGKPFEYWGDKIRDNGFEEDSVEWYINQLNNLNKGGKLVYRGVWAKDEKGINVKKLGKHWSLTPDITSNIDDHEEDQKFFLMTARTVPDSIDYKESLETYTQLPEENEVNFKIQPTLVNIKPKKR